MDSSINVLIAPRTADRTVVFIVRAPRQTTSRDQPDLPHRHPLKRFNCSTLGDPVLRRFDGDVLQVVTDSVRWVFSKAVARSDSAANEGNKTIDAADIHAYIAGSPELTHDQLLTDMTFFKPPS
jgi:hypothetical protein